jgi:energy-coupling factor transport system permease protein
VTWNVRQRFGRYMALESPLHGLDPAAKVILFLVVLVGVLLSASWPALALAGGYVLILCGASRVRSRFFAESLLTFSWMFALSFAVNIIFPRDQGAARLSYEALNVAGLFSVRLVLMILVATLFTLVTSPSEIGDSLLVFARLRGKAGRRAAEFALIVTVALRFVPVMFEEAERIRAAQMLRGQGASSLTDRVRGLVAVIVPLIDSALRRSASLGYALEARCFGYRVPRSAGLRLGLYEVIFGVSGIGLLAVLIWMR